MAADARKPFSPLFGEEQRLWPMMDKLLGYPTEFRGKRIRIAMERSRCGAAARRQIGSATGLLCPSGLTRGQVSDLVPLAGRFIAGGFASFRRPRKSAAHRARLRVGDAGSRRAPSCSKLRWGFNCTAGVQVNAVRTDRGTIGCETW